MVGPWAQRAYEEKRRKGEMPQPPIPEGMNCDLDRAPSPRLRRAGAAVASEPAPKPSDLIIGTIALAPAALLAAKKMRDDLKKSA